MFGQGDQIGIVAHKFLLGFVQLFAVQALIADGDDLRKLADSYRKVVRLLALIGLPLSVVLWFTAQELVLIIFGDQWQPSVPVFRILALSVGIAIQNFPEGAIISMPLRAEGMGKGKAFLYGTLSGVVEPIGAVLTVLAAGLVLPILPYLLSFAAGAMIYVVVEELIPEMSEAPHSNVGTIFYAVGFVLMMTLDVALG